MLIDWFFYRRPLFVPLNIVLYNVFGGEGQGPDIFGTEPWYYYIVNGFLNFNILFLFALGSAPLVVCAILDTAKRISMCINAKFSACSSSPRTLIGNACLDRAHGTQPGLTFFLA